MSPDHLRLPPMITRDEAPQWGEKSKPFKANGPLLYGSLKIFKLDMEFSKFQDNIFVFKPLRTCFILCYVHNFDPHKEHYTSWGELLSLCSVR